MNNSVFVPAHITGFFSIENHGIDLQKGSCGAGFLLDKGVKTTISPSDELKIEVNQGSDVVVREVLNIFECDDDFKITQDIQVPIGCGFGTSAASALSLSLAINEFLDLGYSTEICGQIAHKAEINMGSGLGDVIAQTGWGLVLRTEPGAPGIGEIKSFSDEIFILTKTFGEIDTASVIGDAAMVNLISDTGFKYLTKFVESPSIDNFLKYSYEFSQKTDLLTGEVKSSIEYLNSIDDILGASMAMLGNTVFAFSYDESAFENLDMENYDIYQLNNEGIYYD